MGNSYRGLNRLYFDWDIGTVSSATITVFLSEGKIFTSFFRKQQNLTTFIGYSYTISFTVVFFVLKKENPIVWLEEKTNIKLVLMKDIQKKNELEFHNLR